MGTLVKPINMLLASIVVDKTRVGVASLVKKSSLIVLEKIDLWNSSLVKSLDTAEKELRRNSLVKSVN